MRMSGRILPCPPAAPPTPMAPFTPVSPADSPSAAPPVAPRPKSAPQRALEKLGLRRDIDLALHLPLRYEDETRLTPIGDLRDGSVAQIEGTVRDCQVQTRSRRQLVVRLHDAGDDLVLRFLHFYPTTQKTFAVGARVRARGEARGGLFGLEMVHPTFKVVQADTPLASALTPVYPSTAQLPQAYLRKVVASALQRADLTELLPAGVVPAGLMSLRDALLVLHHPTPDIPLDALHERCHPAWQRLKFEELLAQQLSQLMAKRERARQRAPAFQLQRRGVARTLARDAAVFAHRRTAPGAGRNNDRPATRAADAPAAAGRRGLGQDRRRRSGGGRRDPVGLAVRADGADRNPRRTTPAQAGRLAHAARRGTRLADRQPQGQGAQPDAGTRGIGAGRAGGGHPRGDSGTGRVRAARPGHHRRTASLRRAAAPGVACQAAGAGRRTTGPGAAHADDERDANSTHAGDDAVRRPGHQHHRRVAARAAAGEHPPVRRRAARRGDRAHSRTGQPGPAGVLGLPPGRRIGNARPAERDRNPPAIERRVARAQSRFAARPHARRREGRRDGAVHLAARWRCWSPPP